MEYIHKWDTYTNGIHTQMEYIHKWVISSSSSENSSSPRETRSSIGRFDFRTNYFLC